MLGVGIVLAITVYAHGTTAGVVQDVQGFNSVLRRVLVIPVAVLESLVTIFAPIAVLGELAVRRLGRQVMEVIGAGAAALLLCVAVTAMVTALGSESLVRGLSVPHDGGWLLSIPESFAVLAGLLVTAGPRTRRRTVAWSWNLLWVSLGVVIVTDSPQA